MSWSNSVSIRAKVGDVVAVQLFHTHHEEGRLGDLEAKYVGKLQAYYFSGKNMFGFKIKGLSVIYVDLDKFYVEVLTKDD